jgi:ankyrin repeat protein
VRYRRNDAPPVNIELLKLLIAKGAALEVEYVDAAMVELLLRAGADPEIRDWDDQTPLQNMACSGYVRIVKLLLQFGADVNARPSGRVVSWDEGPEFWPLVVMATTAARCTPRYARARQR